MSTEFAPLNSNNHSNIDHLITIPKRHVKYGQRSSSNKGQLHSRFIGFICIIICIATWISMAEIEPILFAHSFEKPYFINYVATSSLIVMIIPYLIIIGIEQIKVKLKENKKIMTEFSHINRFTNRFMNYHSIDINIEAANTPSISIMAQYKELFVPSIAVSLFYFLNNYLWFMSLYYTIAAVNTTIYQCQCIFVLILSVFMLNKRLTPYNTLSVISSIIGVAMISFLGKEKEDNSSVSPNIFGIISCLSAALCYAIFQVKMNVIEAKYFDQNNGYNKFKSNLFFQFMMGFNILIITWPGFIILDYIGVEQFVFPSSNDWISIIILTAFSLSYIITYIIGITFSGALFMSIGTLLVIPFTYIVDIWLYHLIITPYSIIGSVFVVIGFILMQNNEKKVEDNVYDEDNNVDEIISYLPDIDAASVIEIGCGNGEFTGYLASKATAVLAIDRSDKLLKENQDLFSNKYPHIDYLCRDINNLDLDNESYDFVFDHCCKMKKELNNDEMHKLTDKYYKWLTHCGYIFVCSQMKNGAFTQILDGNDHLKRIFENQSKDNKYYYFLYTKKH